jgi:hypothetical protein
MFRLVQRSGTPYRFKAKIFESLDQAVWAARESDEDYLIEEMPSGVDPTPKVVKYRLGEFEMG